jgi:hypothetical protein
MSDAIEEYKAIRKLFDEDPTRRNFSFEKASAAIAALEAEVVAANTADCDGRKKEREAYLGLKARLAIRTDEMVTARIGEAEAMNILEGTELKLAAVTGERDEWEYIATHWVTSHDEIRAFDTAKMRDELATLRARYRAQKEAGYE